MDQKYTCKICNRLYKIVSAEDLSDCLIPGTSSVFIRLREPNNSTICTGNICPNCARELISKIKNMRRNAPKKCDFCKFDRGPLHESPQPECRDCINHSNFQLKKFKTGLEQMLWDHFNGDLEKL